VFPINNINSINVYTSNEGYLISLSFLANSLAVSLLKNGMTPITSFISVNPAKFNTSLSNVSQLINGASPISSCNHEKV